MWILAQIPHTEVAYNNKGRNNCLNSMSGHLQLSDVYLLMTGYNIK